MKKISPSTLKYRNPTTGKFQDFPYVVGADVGQLEQEVEQLKESIVDQKTDLDALESDVAKYETLTLGVHSDGKIYLFKNGSPVGTGVEAGTTSDIVGYIDSSNNIVLSGTLAEEIYTVKYEMADGSYIDIGELSLVPTYTNFADPTSSDWKTGVRLTSNINQTTALSGGVATNYIPIQLGDTLLVTGINFSDGNDRTAIDGDYASIAKASAIASTWVSSGIAENVTYDGNSLTLTITSKCKNTKNIRFSGVATGTSADVIVNIKRNGEWL